MLTPAAAATRLLAPFASEDLGLDPLPLVAIDLRGAGWITSVDETLMAAAMQRTPAVLVGVCNQESPAHAVSAACDVLVSPELHGDLRTVTPHDAGVANLEALVTTLTAAVARSPLASVTLVELLRLSHDVPVWQALTAESLAYATLQAGPEFARWLENQPQPGNFATAESTRQLVDATRTGERLTITLQDPNRHNAFSAAMRDALVPILHAANTDPGITEVELRGAGPSFCSGGDLREFGSTPDPATAHQIRMTRSAGSLMHQLGDMVTAHVQGAAIGAGAELSAFAENVVAREDSFFQLPEVEMGLIPGAGGTVSITRRIGRQRCAWMALTKQAVNSVVACAWGLADSVLNDYPSKGTETADIHSDVG